MRNRMKAAIVAAACLAPLSARAIESHEATAVVTLGHFAKAHCPHISADDIDTAIAAILYAHQGDTLAILDRAASPFPAHKISPEKLAELRASSCPTMSELIRGTKAILAGFEAKGDPEFKATFAAMRMLVKVHAVKQQ